MADEQTQQVEEGADGASGNGGPPIGEDEVHEATQNERTSRIWEGIETPLLFMKWDFRDVVVDDPGLVKYINLEPIILPHSGARHGNQRFAKHRMNLVERLINELMRTEDYTGKKMSAYRATRNAFEIIAERTKDNPIQVLVKAVQNAAPREEVTRLRYGGISVPKAVDVSPARRLDVAIRNLTTGAVQSSHKSKKGIAMCIADEIMKASKYDMNSFAVAKKEELERVAKSAR